MDPDGRETQLVVGLHTAQNPVGHVAIAINNTVYSFGTNWTAGEPEQRDWGGDLGTYLNAQGGSRETVILTLAVTPEQETALQSMLDTKNPNAPGAAPYQELSNSCVTVCEQALENAGILPNESGPVIVDRAGNLFQAGASASITPQGLAGQVQDADLVTNTTTVGTRPRTSKLGAFWNAIKDLL